MKSLVVKDNALINASYNLDLVEQRLILLAIVEARQSGKGINANDPLTVHAESYVNQFGVHRNTAYQALKDACEDLFARQFSYQDLSPKGNVINARSRWVSEVRYIDNEAIVQLIFSPAIIPLITQLEKQFTSYELEQISDLSSAYAVRLYEILIAWRGAGKTPIIEIQEFRHKMGVLEGEYTRSDNFKKWVIEQSIKQINEHTDITVKYEQHKQGRSIVGFSFAFKQKKKSLKVLEEKSKPVKKTVEPLKNAWNTPENSLFKTLYAKCPTLTKEYVENLAKTQNKSIHDLLNIMFMEYAKVDSFELQPSS